MRKLKLLLASVALLFGGGISVWAQTDVTSTYLTNADFSGTYSAITATPTAVSSNRSIFQPDGWSIDLVNKSVNNMTVIKNDDPQQSSNFTGTYAPGDGKYMVRFRDNQTSEYIELSQTITITEAGLYFLSAYLIRENSSKAIVELFAGTQKVGNSQDGAWEKRYLLLNVSANQEIKLGVKFSNKGAGGHKVGADNIKLEKLNNAPVDVTNLVYNPNFDSDIKGWTAPSGGAKLANNKTEQTTNFYETWNSDPKQGRMYQVLEGLPQGTYQLKIFAFADQKGTMTPANTDVCVYAQGQEVGTSTSSHIHRNYVNSTDFTYYKTWAYVDATGKLEIGMRQDVATFQWLGMDNVTLEYICSDDQEDALLLDELQSKWSSVKTAFEAQRDGTYSNVTGSEKTELNTALEASVSSIADYSTNAAALNTAYLALTAAKSNYDAFDTEKANALAMGVSAGSIVRPVSGSSSDLENALHALYVLEDAAANSGYTVDATDIFGTWTTQNLGTNSGQHWSGDGSVSYFDKWDTKGYTSSITNTVTLPEGKYVFKVAARAQSGGINGAFNMSVKIGTADATYQDFVAKSDTGKGIDTSGAVNYGDGTFANENNGRGWEWRFIAFELDAETEVVMKVYAQIYAYNWVGFTDPTLLTTSDNIGICQMIWSDAKTAAESARDDALYSNITGKERTDLVATITAAGTEPNTVVGYQSQTSALNDAKATFIGVKGTYDEYAQESVVATVFGIAVPAIDPASTTAATLITNMQTMNVSDYSAATTNYTYDATALLGAWTNAPGTNKGESWDGTGDDTYYDEYNASARAMSQTITLPKASYVLIAKGRASVDGKLTMTDGTNTVTFPHKSSTGKGIETDGTPNFGDGTYANSNNGRGWEYRFLTFESDGTTATTLTFNWTTSSSNWAGLDDITLLAIPETETISEDATEAPVYTLANVTLTRTLSASYWNTFSVPFDAEIPTGWEVKKFASATDNVILFADATSFEAGKPYLVKPTANVVNPTFDGVIVENTSGETEGTGNYKFAAQIYNKALATDGTIAYLATDGSIKKLTSGSIKGLRAYFIIPASGAPARLSFGDDETTGISTMHNAQFIMHNELFDLQGRKVTKPAKGLYIKNGKKVVMK